MTLYRYLSRELFFSTVSVGCLLVVVMVAGRFIRYLAEASQADFLLQIMLWRLPGFLELLLPLSLFVGVLLAFGRLYLQNEMVVLFACGISRGRILAMMLVPAGFMALFVALFSLFLTPLGNKQVELLVEKQKQQSDFELLTPGYFHTKLGFKTSRATYVKGVSDDKKMLEEVFIAERHQNVFLKDGPVELVTIAAEKGYRYNDRHTGAQYLLLEKGYHYQGDPNTAEFTVVEFDEYLTKISDGPGIFVLEQVKTMPLAQLWEARHRPDAWAELQWRMTLPVMVPVVLLIAFSLAQVNPRQGRFLKLLPALLLFITYLLLLIASRSWLTSGSLPAELGLWWVHLVFAGLGLLLFNWQRLVTLWQRRQQERRQERERRQG